MKLKNNKFKIDIVTVSADSLNLKADDCVYFGENAEDEFSKSRIITIDNGNTIRKIILVGDFFLYDSYCAVLTDSVLTVLQNDKLVQIDLNTCRIAKQKSVEEFGGSFELHLTPAGYLVYGESSVAVYDKDLNQMLLKMILLSFMILKVIITSLILTENL